MLVQPGYLRDKLPSRAPQEGQAFEVIMQDVKDQIMPGLSRPQKTFMLLAIKQGR